MFLEELSLDNTIYPENKDSIIIKSLYLYIEETISYFNFDILNKNISYIGDQKDPGDLTN